MPWVKLVLNLWKVLGHHCPDIYIQCDSFGIAAGISMSVVLTVFTNSTVTIKEGDPKIHLNSLVYYLSLLLLKAPFISEQFIYFWRALSNQTVPYQALNSNLNFTVKKHTSQKWNGRWQKQILGLPLSSNTLGANCHVGYVNK